MKKYYLIYVSLLLSATSLLAQRPINDPDIEVRNVSGFHAIKVSSGIELLLTQSNTEAVAVSAAREKDRNRIKTYVENGVLKIYYDNIIWKLWQVYNGRKLRAYVSVINIDNIDISSGARVQVEGSLSSDKLGIDASGGSVFRGQVVTGDLDVDQSSGALITISGTAGKLYFDGSSGCVFQGYELVADQCDIETSSGAVAQVTVNKEISAAASSGGLVSYKGAASIRRNKTSSGGNIIKKGK